MVPLDAKGDILFLKIEMAAEQMKEGVVTAGKWVGAGLVIGLSVLGIFLYAGLSKRHQPNDGK